MFVLKCASVMSIYLCCLGTSILLEEGKAAGVQRVAKPAGATPAIDKMKAIGQWNEAGNPFLELDPSTDQFMARGGGIYGSGVLPPKDIELLPIDVSYTDMYAPDTWRHVKNALKAGATMEEIMEVLKLCVAQGVQACNLGVPILAEELERK